MKSVIGMKTKVLALGIVSTFAVGVILFQIRKTRQEKRSLLVADAGYETAYDVLYPVKTKRFKRR